MLEHIINLIAPAGLVVYGFLCLKESEHNSLKYHINNVIIVVSLFLFCIKLQSLYTYTTLNTILKAGHLDYFIIFSIACIISFIMLVLTTIKIYKEHVSRRD